MARLKDWKREIRDALGRPSPEREWSLAGPNRLVKVVRLAEIMNRPEKARAVGFVTQEKHLFGKTPDDIERALGLPPFSLRRGCRVYRLERLPTPREYSDELNADHPDGLPFNPADAEEARIRFVRDKSLNEVPFYPPGDPRVPQWRVSVEIPLIHLIDLWPNVTYPKPT